MDRQEKDTVIVDDGPTEKLTEAKIKLMITEDILLRAPLWGLVVLVFLGSIAFGTIWFSLHVIKPFIEQNVH